VSFDLDQPHIELRIEVLWITAEHDFKLFLSFVDAFEFQVLRAEIISRGEILRRDLECFLKVVGSLLEVTLVYELESEFVLLLSCGRQRLS
jgi:hypothetical protein